MDSRTLKNYSISRILLLIGIIMIFIFMPNSCAKRMSEFSTTFYSFEYKGDNYRIRSIASANGNGSFNELIGAEFVARDFDQDGLIDEITLGEINLADAQVIYEYALIRLTAENKLSETTPQINVYQYANSEFNYEIKSFRTDHVEPFNQFKMVKNGRVLNPPVFIADDKKADGILDEIIKGDMTLEEIQTYYSNVLKKGIEEKALIEQDDRVLVKLK